jgi:glutamyl-tRNA synthetase
MKGELLRYVLENALKFGGKASSKAVIGKLFQKNKNLKIKSILPEVEKVVKEVNSMSLEEQKAKLKELGKIKTKKKITKKEGLKPLKNVKGKVVMRFAPSPSGPMHIGHAMILGVISEYCRMYNGKLIFRIEDTNPENIYPPAYKIMPKEAQWLTRNNVDEILIQSDRLNIYYKYVEKLIDKNAAYVCECDPDKYRKLIYDMKACPCRDLPKEEQKIRWKKMFNSYKQGEAVVRVKTDIKDKNPAMRDFPIARINKTKHPRQGKKYRVWPLMNLSVFVDDVEYGMTHIIRGKDHADNAKRQEFLYRHFNKPIPITLFQGRINFIDMQVSCSKTREAIEKRKYLGWDDIRLPFLAALKRRGYQPEAIVKWAVSIGVSLTDKKVSKEEFFKVINAFNKEIVDPVARRYFFVKKPMKIIVEGAPKRKLKLRLHPDKDFGFRNFEVSDKFYVEEEDFKKFKNGKLYRLMDCLNFIKKGKKFVFDSLEYDKFKEKGENIIHWLPVSKDLVNIEVLMDDGSLLRGLGEKGLRKVKVGEVIQFERFAFIRCDKKSKDKLVFWFGHR